MFVVCALTLALAACGGSTESPSCGEGTERQGDECVAVADDGPECGTDTVLEEGQCVAAEDAGYECGAGTMLSDGECLPESEVQCGDGTTIEGEDCVPDETACGEGVEFDAQTGECVAGTQIECGENTVEEDGVCVSSEESLRRPDGAKNVISDADLKRIEEIGMTIYGGTNPPDIAGRYHSDDAYVVYDETQGGWLNDPTEYSVCEGYWEYTSTGEDLKYESARNFTSCQGSYSGQETWVSGTGSCFTTYSSVSGTFEGCSRDDINIRSGCLTEDGIANTSRANFGKNYQGDSCSDLVSEGRMGAEGEIRMRQEGIMVRQNQQ